MNKSMILIKPNSFRPGVVGIEVYVRNQDGDSGSSQIEINIIPDKPIIILDRAIGSIPLKADFRIDASHSIDPSDSCSSLDNKNCLKFEWVCYKNKEKCKFNYNQKNSFLLISQNYVNDRLFDSFELLITSVYGIESKLQIEIDIVDTEYVPDVIIREYFTKKTRSRIASFKDFVVEALFLDEKLMAKRYKKNWVLNTEKDKILSKNLIVVVQKILLKPGLDYRLTFKLIENDLILNYYYDFTVNIPPIPGKINFLPKKVEVLKDLITIIANNWTDSESDYPLLYAFGYYSDKSNVKLISKQSNKIFQTYLSYIGQNMHIYVHVYDSLGDYSELSKEIEVEHSRITSDNLVNMEDELFTQMTQNIPAFVSVIVTGFLNNDLYNYPNKTELSFLQRAFSLSQKYLNRYIDNTRVSEDSVSQISSILVQMTTKKILNSPKNLKLIVQTINSLLAKSETIGLTTDQSNNLYKVLENSFNHSFELVKKKKELSILMTLYEKINQARAKNMFVNQLELINSNNAITKLYGLEPFKLENSKFSSEASVTFPSDISVSNLNNYAKIVLSLTYIPLEKSDNSDKFTQNLVIITLFNLENAKQIPFDSNSSIAIEIPFNNQEIEDQLYSCLYFDYSSKKWDDQGCTVSEYTNFSITCECSHLSTFTAGNYRYNESNSKNFEFLSFKTIGLYICLSLFFIYLIFAVICLIKDKKELRNNYEKVFQNFKKKHDNEKLAKKENKEAEVNQNEIEIEENAERTKTGIEALKQRLIALTIYFYTDSSHCRLFRCSSAFFELIGIIIFTAIFFNILTLELTTQNIINQFTKISGMSTVFSIFILKAINLLLCLVFKEKDLASECHNINDLNETDKRNILKIICAVIFYFLSMIIFCSIIVFIVQKFGKEKMKLWLITVGYGMAVELIFILLIKIVFIDFIWSYFKLKYEMKKLNDKTMINND